MDSVLAAPRLQKATPRRAAHDGEPGTYTVRANFEPSWDTALAALDNVPAVSWSSPSLAVFA